MKWVILLTGVVVICFVAALVLGLVGGGMGAATSSLRHEPLPDAPLTDDDLDALELDVTARGYRMSQVDGVIDRLRRELREKDEEIAVLRGDQAAGGAEPPEARAPSDETPEPVDTPPHDTQPRGTQPRDSQPRDAADPSVG